MNKDGLSRRDFLKRGAALGGALVWVAPVVQVVGMRPAFGQETVSPVCSDYFAIKIDPTDDDADDNDCVDISSQTDDDPKGQGHCLDVDAMGVTPGAGGCQHVMGTNLDNSMEWVITLAEGCVFTIGQAELKTGGNLDEKCFESGVFNPANNTITFTHDPKEISNIQVVFCKFPAV